MNKIILILIIIFMTMLGSLGGFFFKKSDIQFSIPALIKNKYLYLGVVFYVVSAVFNIFVLKFMPYSVVLPMTAITYIWSMVLSKFILKEKITGKKVIGMASIIVGAIFISIY